LDVIKRTVAVDDASTRVLEAGSGSPLILMHGGTLGCSAEDWAALLPWFAARGFRAIAYDQPGYGESSRPADATLAYRQRFILSFLDALEIGRAALVGHSQAGRLALVSAIDSANRFSSATVLCTRSLLPPLGDRGAEAELPARAPTLDQTRTLLEAYVYDREVIGDSLVARFERYSTGANFENAIMRAAIPLSVQDAAKAVPPDWQRLGDVSSPLMLIYGANDNGPVTDRVALARDRYPGLPIHLLDRCGHFAQWDQPETVGQLIADFALIGA
jgi:pimeloyl-ACP methyl ester carboxylesterase